MTAIIMGIVKIISVSVLMGFQEILANMIVAQICVALMGSVLKVNVFVRKDGAILIVQDVFAVMENVGQKDAYVKQAGQEAYVKFPVVTNVQMVFAKMEFAFAKMVSVVKTAAYVRVF
jgi:hypothetical protein